MKKKANKPAAKASKNKKVAAKSAATKKIAKPVAKGGVKKVLSKVASKIAKKVKAAVPAAATKEKKNKKGSAPASEAPLNGAEQAAAEEAEVVLTNADGKQYCKSPDCDEAATSQGYCRLHYLTFWKRNKVKAKILEGGKLDKYIEELTSKYPDKYMEMLRKDLASEKDFNAIIAEMDVEDSNDDAEAEEETGRYIEEVRGGIGGHGTGDDDEGF